MLKGILEGMVLEIIGQKEVYGYQILKQLTRVGFPDIAEGTVYTILLRLERNHLVTITKRPSELGPPRKFYTLNDAGEQRRADFWRNWRFICDRIEQLNNGGQAYEIEP